MRRNYAEVSTRVDDNGCRCIIRHGVVMQNSYSKVIGYWAYRSRAEVVCAEHDACLIAGSEEAMREYVREFTGQTADKHTIRKTRFGEILDGIRIGAAYAFDEEAYSRFLPLARGAGLQAEDADFEKARTHGQRFFTFRYIQIKPVAGDFPTRITHED